MKNNKAGKTTATLCGLFMLAGAGMMNAPEAAAKESACAAPDPEKDLDRLSQNPVVGQDYYEWLELSRRICVQERMVALALAADEDTVSVALDGLESVIRKDKSISVVGQAMRGVVMLAKKFPESANKAVGAIAARLDSNPSVGDRYLVLDRIADVMANSESPQVAEEGYRYIRSLAADENGEVRKEAAAILFKKLTRDPGIARHQDEIVSLLDKMQGDPDATVSETAKKALAVIKAIDQGNDAIRRILQTRPTAAPQPQ